MLYTVLTVVHVLVCLFLIGVVLLQSGKAADLAGAFGGMGSQTAFGPRGSATLLSKLTTGSAVVFMMTSLTLSILATRGGNSSNSVLEKTKAPTAPAAPISTTTIPQPGAATQPVTTPAAPAAPGKQPSVTLIDESTGKSTTQPLNIPVPGQAPAQQPAKK
jgi:preprotein translocase subunit SecG